MGKKLGQHFLRNKEILQRIVNSAEIGPQDKVVEIGAGMGDLTELLIKTTKEVIAIELDPFLFKILEERFVQRENLKLVNQDALKFPFEEIGTFKVVANIPYYITKPIIFRLIEARNLISMTLTIQKEVAQRLVAKPGSKAYSTLSIIAQYYTIPEIKFYIPPKFFSPPPKVESAVIKMDRRNAPLVELEDERLFFKIVKASFGQRRKMISNSLKSIINQPKEFLLKIGIDPMKRAEEFKIEDFAYITNELCKFCK
ncbi:MAG: 16S rRNA (adenine(1518)-N(6)/adenine(1519)-N(6))-dimethyltransferase RsmA [Thermodesulfovibrio sp.]|uniref:16S rRNA (adenine(1518)-N(6)/adenine(1519)-N(6))- dimethyltransferase RsmA n=1 Tax=Thermodesulfovibrio sp. 1176 TaxID=3043424 RepID=UPI0024824E21|nr:16S rRNA (adenine(1518)-N(6)/adenine(1519)-N(6))-dimethyltransferase RsmA [Thermodesulfovibrio sp. 1176]MDI1472702.1 16S rRNA (adenine(1518)-N(6)/adenine(1519)-N(6))-dimethyltransferase RsmA [Thermodesulfovibrio sp. 1176]MDI6713400.1 16S rRNA (adenine(1518)-N(6)/adenine(1519)-N(6))-dimethyltransferase RsmA [Thermodesulfovibrio sp.]